jgi:hypothetical protein
VGHRLGSARKSEIESNVLKKEAKNPQGPETGTLDPSNIEEVPVRFGFEVVGG